jgi:hypothetical protein
MADPMCRETIRTLILEAEAEIDLQKAFVAAFRDRGDQAALDEAIATLRIFEEALSAYREQLRPQAL